MAGGRNIDVMTTMTDIRESFGRTRLGRRIQERLARRAEETQLRRDLATYTTPSDLAELYALVERNPEGDTAPIRNYLNTRPLVA